MARLRRLHERWTIAVRPKRWLALIRTTFPLRKGVTVVIVNWNSLDCLRSSVDAVRRFSPADTRIVVLDNHSDDGSQEWLATQPRVTAVRLPRNIGHGPALDIGVLGVGTRYFVTLDVDAFPIASGWIEDLITRLDSGAHVAGAHGGWCLDRLMGPDLPEDWANRDFVHPCCLAMRTRRFAVRSHSFIADKVALRDVGVNVSERETGHLSYWEPTSVDGPGALGTVFGGFVYHNFYGTRHGRQGSDLVDGISVADARAAWTRNTQRYLGAAD